MRALVDDGFNPTGLPQVMDEIVNGAVQRTYAYGLQRIDEIQFVQGAWTPSFYVYDGGGSVRQLANTGQTVTDTYDYDAFGNVVNKTGTTPNNYLYRGEQYDPDLGLYYLRARYYNPLTDRFLSRDPAPGNIAIPGTLHKYLYAGGDGVNYVDPTGRAALVETSVQNSTQAGGTTAETAYTGRRVACVIMTGASIYAVYLAAEQLIHDTDTTSQVMDGIGVIETLVALTVVAEECGAKAEVKEESAGGCCFAKGTPVHTSHGDVAIENIHEGDSVISRNAQTGQLEPEPVTALTPLHPSSLLEVRLEGQQAPLRPSINHPFWVKRGNVQDGSWLRADKMQVGDFVQSVQGAWRRVVAITPLPGVETVYNFTVDQNHDYFVGETGFLVHNQSCPCRILFSRDPSEILGSDTFGHGPWAGRTLDEAVTEAQELGGLPEGLELNASWVNDAMVAANNRTLWVAIKAGLINVPVKGLDSNKVWNTVRQHLDESGGPFEPPCD